MARIILNRTSEYVNRLRNYNIYIDEKKIGTIANGETKEFPVTSGHHSIVTKIDWCSSRIITFDVKGDETKEFKVSGFKNAKWLMTAALIIIILSCTVNSKFGLEYLFYFVVPALFLLVYYLTVGRKRYLTLTAIESEIQGKTAMQ